MIILSSNDSGNEQPKENSSEHQREKVKLECGRHECNEVIITKNDGSTIVMSDPLWYERTFMEGSVINVVMVHLPDDKWFLV